MPSGPRERCSHSSTARPSRIDPAPASWIATAAAEEVLHLHDELLVREVVPVVLLHCCVVESFAVRWSAA